MVVYPSAFDTLKSALRYTYTRDGFEQDIILYENPGSPADYGLHPDTTLLEMYSEFFNPPAPTVQSSSDNDQTLNFGQMQMGRGQAYFLNEDLGAADVNKTWANISGRTFLVESVPYPAVRAMLEKMALAQGQASNRSVQDRKGLVASLRPREQPIRVASIKPGKSKSDSGFLIDFVTKNSNLTDFLWLGDTTYFISGNVGLYGTNTVFEGGVVLKYTNNVSLTVNTPLTWQGSRYRPVVLTARDDPSVGETITPSNALSGYYATVALVLDGNAANTNFVLQNLRVANAQTAIAIYGKSGHAVTNAQLVSCQNGFSATNAEFSLRNALFDHVLTNFNGSSSTGRIEHLTVDTASWLNNSIGTNLYLTNCLLVAVTNTGSIGGSNTVYSTSASGVFCSSGQGFHYLNTNSSYRDVGTTNINSTLAAQLQKLTTYPPLILTSDFTVSTTLSPQAQRDTDVPDVGWHYDPLDYCWNGLNLTNSSTLTLTNGVAVGIYGTKGTTLRTGANFISEGQPNNLNRLVRYQTVQEQSVLWGATAGTMSLIDIVENIAPQTRLTFTDVSLMADSLNRRTLLVAGSAPFIISHSQLRGIFSGFNDCPVANNVITWTNNLFERPSLSWGQQDSSNPFTLNLYNNLFRFGSVTFVTASNPTAWTVKDNLFDCDSATKSGNGTVTFSNNGYRSGLSSLGGTGNKTGLVPDYLIGPLGNYYYPTNGSSTSLTNLVDAGSRTAANAGLYHFTTRVDQTKEAGTTVDIGYHYVAVDGNGNALDYDGDGLPDYFEDRNGNGVTDTGETKWQDPNDLGLKVWITEPKSNSNIP